MNSKTNKLLILLLFIAIPIAGLALMTPDAHAFNFYSDLNSGGDSGTGGCADCHTAFRKGGTYTSTAEGGVSWGTTLHNVHLNNTNVGASCDNCHGGAGSNGRGVNLSSSATGPGGAMALACSGCHGRQADTVGNPNTSGAGWGAGLRQHHFVNGETLCLGCHEDADPANFTAAGEDAMPMYYANVTNNIVGLNLEPCNEFGEEQLAGLAIGLDNDGDNAYDTADTDCGCQPTGVPETICNGIDDDCDLLIDEDYMIDAACGLGVCGPPNNTPSSCVDGVETLCQPGPQDEATDVTCDGVDGDCDGQIDEDYMPMNTTCGIGECASTGQTTCVGGVEGDTCTPLPAPEPGMEMTCDDGLDNDCDGVFDDVANNPVNPDPDCTGCTDMDNDGFSPDGGACGPIDCNDMDDTIFPGADETVCNGVDNDCDLLIDEDYMQMPTTCGIGVCASTGQTTCVGGVEGDTCVAGPPDEATDVTCDGLDGDCDGQVDEDYIIDAVCGLGVCGPPNNTPSSCVSGVETLCQPGPQDEATDVTCDGVDGDCDGSIDEDFVSSNTTCGVGICASTGLLACIGGNEVDSCMPGTPGVEGPEGDPTCIDGADNDCDNLTDGADQDCGASAIPPPVNQNIGRDDSIFNNLEQADCRFCHENVDTPVNVEGKCSETGTVCFVDADCTGGTDVCEDVLIKDRHHILALTPENIPDPGSLIFYGTCSVTATTACNTNSDCPGVETCNAPLAFPPYAPVDPDRDKDTVRDTIYGCNNCHPDNPATPIIDFTITRDCTMCHVQVGGVEGPGSVHHNTPTANGTNSPIGDPNVGDCTPCHGSLVDDTGDGHVIPTYDPSLVTPRRSDGFGPVNAYQNGRGACNFCHDQDTVPPATPLVIQTNETNHHSTGLNYLGVCEWCHFGGFPSDPVDPLDIRTCENCHGYESLHNIATNSDATGLVDTDGDGVPDTPNLDDIFVGAENPYFGHVGNNDDCLGCHGGYIPANAPGTGPITPFISGYNVPVMTAGTDKAVTLTGSAFTNVLGTTQWTSAVTMTASDGSSITLTPDAIDEGSLTVTVPGTTAPGNYDLHAVKDTAKSNPVVISVIPDVAIASVDCNKKKGMITVTGTGFGNDKPEGTDADLNLQVDGQTVELISWADTQIKGSVDRCSNRATVTVNAVFGSATNGKPCKGKKCR